MTKEMIIEEISKKLKLIRTEYNLSQEEMAKILSISKKTLVQVEKNRINLNWNVAVTITTIFDDSEIINLIFGGDIQDTIKSISFGSYEKLSSTLGGKVWWKDIKKEYEYRIQQNIISKHYRILNIKNERICSSFDEVYIKNRFKELCNKKKKLS